MNFVKSIVIAIITLVSLSAWALNPMDKEVADNFGNFGKTKTGAGVVVRDDGIWRITRTPDLVKEERVYAGKFPKGVSTTCAVKAVMARGEMVECDVSQEILDVQFGVPISNRLKNKTGKVLFDFDRKVPLLSVRGIDSEITVRDDWPVTAMAFVLLCALFAATAKFVANRDALGGGLLLLAALTMNLVVPVIVALITRLSVFHLYYAFTLLGVLMLGGFVGNIIRIRRQYPKSVSVAEE